MEQIKLLSREAYPMEEGVTKSYRYTGSPSYFCKIDATPKPPYMRHPKGWSPEQQRKLDRLKNKEKENI